MMIARMVTGMVLAAAATGAAARAGLLLQPESRVWVEGTSTVRAYKCTAATVTGTVAGESARTVAELQNAVTGVRIEIPVKEMGCGNGTMEGHMRKALKAEAAPTIEYEGIEHTVDGSVVTMTGTLRIAGQENVVEITATATEEQGGIRVKGSKQINMTEWGVKPPSLMLGTLKVRDAVTIHFDVLLK